MAIEQERELQTEAAVRAQVARLQDLNDLALPLLHHGVGVCGNRGLEFGFRYRTLDEYGDEAEREGYHKVFGVQSRPTVLFVMANGAAARGGLVRGDVIREVATSPIPLGERGRDMVRQLLEGWPTGRPLPLSVEREGAAVTVEITPEPICDYPVSLRSRDEVNAFADGHSIHVNVGLMRFAQSDEEVQAAIAHEIAHNTEGHFLAQVQNLVLEGLRGAVRDAAVAVRGVRPSSEFTQIQEREADYVGMYFLARAGIDTRDFGLFWRRRAVDDLNGVRRQQNATHPPYPERFVQLEAIRQEIARKLESGRPLLPNRTATGALIVPPSG